MRLQISRSEHYAEPDTLHRTTLRLRSGGEPPHYIKPWLTQQSLNELAHRWFLIHASRSTVDSNAALIANDPVWTNLAVEALEKGVVYTSVDPVMVAAFEERIRRACDMLVLDHLYETYLKSPRHVTVDLSAESRAEAAVSSLPTITDEVRQQATAT